MNSEKILLDNEHEKNDEPIVLTKVKLNGSEKEGQKKINKVITGQMNVEQLSRTQAEELKLLLTEKGLTLEFLLGRYKDIASSEAESVKASDILKALDSLMKFHGVGEEKTETSIKVGALLRSKSTDEMQQYLVELTTKTTKYLSSLKDKEQEPSSDVP